MALKPLSKSVLAANITMAVLATMAVALRIFVRKWKRLTLKGDDYTIVLALVMTLGLCAEGIYAGVENIFGLIMYSDVIRNKADHIFWVDVLVMHTVYGVIKLSVLMFYKRIFKTRRFTQVANGSIVFVITWMTACFFAQLFCTTPINKMWATNFDLKWNYNYGAFLFAMAMIDITSDMFILCLPMPMVKTLQMSRKKKISLSALFALGFFCIVSTSVRAYYFWKLNIVLQPANINLNVHRFASWSDIWGHVEAGASIVTACLPTFTPLFASSSRSEKRNSRRRNLGSNDKLGTSDITFTNTSTSTNSSTDGKRRLVPAPQVVIEHVRVDSDRTLFDGGAAERNQSSFKNKNLMVDPPDMRIMVSKSWHQYVEDV